MATLGYLAPHSTQSTEGLHALRRTAEGLLYYTKINKDGGDSVDFEGGSPTDKRVDIQLPTTGSYVDENLEFQGWQQTLCSNTHIAPQIPLLKSDKYRAGYPYALHAGAPSQVPGQCRWSISYCKAGIPD